MSKFVKWMIITLFAAVLIYMGYFAYSVYQFASSINSDTLGDRFKNLKDLTADYQPPAWDGSSRVNVLIMGGDARGLKKGEMPRSDTLLIASFDPQTKKTILFSVLRDTWVSIPNHGHDRINTALSAGGPNLVMETLSDYLGIPIQFYVYTDFQGFIAMVNTLGGVPIDVEKNMDYTDAADGHRFDIHLKQGLQQLNGEQSLGYVRFRHDARSDFARTERQRKFLKALAGQMKSTTGIMKLPKLLADLGPFVESNMDFSTLLQVGTMSYKVKLDEVNGIQIPPQKLLHDAKKHGASVLEADEKELQKFIQEELSK